MSILFENSRNIALFVECALEMAPKTTQDTEIAYRYVYLLERTGPQLPNEYRHSYRVTTPHMRTRCVSKSHFRKKGQVFYN